MGMTKLQDEEPEKLKEYFEMNIFNKSFRDSDANLRKASMEEVFRSTSGFGYEQAGRLSVSREIEGSGSDKEDGDEDDGL